LGAGGALGGPARPGVNFGGKTANLGAAPHDWGFAKNCRVLGLQKNSSSCRQVIIALCNKFCKKMHASLLFHI